MFWTLVKFVDRIWYLLINLRKNWYFYYFLFNTIEILYMIRINGFKTYYREELIEINWNLKAKVSMHTLNFFKVAYFSNKDETIFCKQMSILWFLLLKFSIRSSSIKMNSALPISILYTLFQTTSLLLNVTSK